MPSTPLLSTTILIVFPASLLIQRWYFQQYQQFKRLHLIASQLLQSYFTEMVANLAHVRAFQRQEEYMRRSYVLIDRYRITSHYLFILRGWLQFAVNLLFVVLDSIYVLLVVYGSATSYTTCIGFVSLLFMPTIYTSMIEYWVICYNNLTAFQKVLSFIETTPQERIGGRIAVPAHWPSQGDIVLDDVSISYR